MAFSVENEVIDMIAKVRDWLCIQQRVEEI